MIYNGSKARGSPSHRKGCKIERKLWESIRAERVGRETGQSATLGTNNRKTIKINNIRQSTE